MDRIAVLGGAGGIGSVAVRALAALDDFDAIVVADARQDAAQELVISLADGRVTAAPLDAADPASVSAILSDVSVALNCVGPCYRHGPPVLEAAIEAGVGYVDVCDDLAPTRTMLDLDDAARRSGVTALIGMGNSPGLANVFVKLCAEQLLDEVTSADIMHVHGGEPEEGPAVVKHRIHAMTNDVPLYVDGELVHVRMLEDSGRAFVAETDFRDVGTFPVYPYPHPETVTLPRVFPSLTRVTNLGVVFPLSYFHLTMDLVRVGLGSREPLIVDGVPVVPLEVAVAHILRERPRLLAEAGITGPGGCLKVVVRGSHEGAEHTYICSMSSTEQGAGEGTGIPAALGAVLLRRGALAGGPGVHPPEAVVPVDEILSLAGHVVGALGTGEGGVPLHLEHVAPDGSRDELALGIG